jgi:hypothetical protein
LNTRKDRKGKKVKRSVLTRKIRRNLLKSKVGSNKISEPWRNYQISKHQDKITEYLKNRKKEKGEKQFDSKTLLKFIGSFLKRKKVG